MSPDGTAGAVDETTVTFASADEASTASFYDVQSWVLPPAPETLGRCC